MCVSKYQSKKMTI